MPILTISSCFKPVAGADFVSRAASRGGGKGHPAAVPTGQQSRAAGRHCSLQQASDRWDPPSMENPPSIEGTSLQSSPRSGGSKAAALCSSCLATAQLSSIALLSPFERIVSPRGPSAASGPSKLWPSAEFQAASTRSFSAETGLTRRGRGRGSRRSQPDAASTCWALAGLAPPPRR